MEWNNTAREQEMLEAYQKQAAEMAANPERFRKSKPSLKVGFESEVAIYNDSLPLEKFGHLRDAIIGEIPDIGDHELGASQIEFRTPPINLLACRGPKEIVRAYRHNWSRVVRAALKHGCRILRVGANPFLPALGTLRTDQPKYRIVPDFYNHYRRKDVDIRIGLSKEQIDIGDAAVVSLFQSFQINLEARSFDDAVDKMNRSFMIAPYLLALSGNSRYLECLDTSYTDCQMPAWERSHDTGMADMRLIAWERAFDTRSVDELHTGHALRVGLPERYFRDIEDYLNRAGSFPFILYNPANALKIAIGMTWLDTRVKFIGNSAVVELRLLPTQPNLGDEFNLTLLYIGMLLASQEANDNLLPLELVRENRLQAMLHGLHGAMWFRDDQGSFDRLPYWQGMKREVYRAKSCLESYRLLCYFDQGFLAKVERWGSPVDRLATALQDQGNRISHHDMKQALIVTGMSV